MTNSLLATSKNLVPDDGTTRPNGLSVSFRRRAPRAIAQDKSARFRPIFEREHRGALGPHTTDGFAGNVAGRVELFPVKATMKAQGFATRSRCIEGKGAEFDPPGDEALDIEDVQAFAQPVHEERFGRSSVGADFPYLPLLDRGRVCQKREDAEGDLGEGLGQGLAVSHHPPGSADVDIAEGRGSGRAQEPPPMRSP